MRPLALLAMLALAACSAPRDEIPGGDADVPPSGQVPAEATPIATASPVGDSPSVVPRSNLPSPPPPPGTYPPPAPPSPTGRVTVNSAETPWPTRPPPGANPSRDMTDLVAGCAGMAPGRRPRGSNCHGIFPEQCGADRAQRYVGKTITPELRQYLSGISVSRTRITEPGQAVTDDLDPSRLNVILDGNDRIAKVDCY